MARTNGDKPTFAGFGNPSYTQVPDELFDELMPQLTEAELRVLLYVIRRTFGFKKSSDDISLKQLVEGIRTKDGLALDHGAGVGKTAAVRAVKGLVEKGVITARRNQSVARGYEATTYGMRFRENTLVHQGNKGASSPREHALVHQGNIQETVRQQTERTFEFRKASHDFLDREADQAEQPGAAVAASEEVELADREFPRPATTERVLSDSGALEGHAGKPHGTTPPPASNAYRTFKQQALRQRTVRLTATTGRRMQATSNAPESVQDVLTREGEHLIERGAHRAPLLNGTRGRPPGSREDREHVAAYLRDFMRELHDQSKLSSAVTRALNLFKAANVPPERWSDYLYQARAITQEHSAQISKTIADGKGQFGTKNKAPYFFEVLTDLLGLRPNDTIQSTQKENSP